MYTDPGRTETLGKEKRQGPNYPKSERKEYKIKLHPFYQRTSPQFKLHDLRSGVTLVLSRKPECSSDGYGSDENFWASTCLQVVPRL